MTLKTSDFDYPLDPALIAQQPLERRDQSRLMVLDRRSGHISHHVFSELPKLLRAGDLLVINDTKVLPARFDARRSSGGRIEGLFCREVSAGRWGVMLKNAGRCKTGEKLFVEGGEDLILSLEKNLGQGAWLARINPPLPAIKILEDIGQPPLPPYIRREDGATPTDRNRYQTVYAVRPGAVAAPTAGLHFTPELLDALTGAGIEQVSLTLHVGPGTFTPIKCEDLRRHRMHAEWYELTESAAEAINRARSAGRRVVAVGTTALRVLETVAPVQGPLAASSGWTDIFIHPPFRFRAVDALITNFHLPRSTLLVLVAAFCDPNGESGLKTILETYRQAADLRYRFYSYGDAMLIE